MITDTPSSTHEQTQSSPSETNETNKYSHYSTVGDNCAEAILAFIAYFFLIIGILASVIVGGFLIITCYDSWLCLIGLAILIVGSMISLIIWANCMIRINISNNTRQTKYAVRELVEIVKNSSR